MTVYFIAALAQFRSTCTGRKAFSCRIDEINGYRTVEW